MTNTASGGTSAATLRLPAFTSACAALVADSPATSMTLVHGHETAAGTAFVPTA